MQIVMILVPVMMILVALGIVLFSWAVKNGQYDDLEGPAHRILYDDDKDLIPDEARNDPNASNAKAEPHANDSPDANAPSAADPGAPESDTTSPKP